MLEAKFGDNSLMEGLIYLSFLQASTAAILQIYLPDRVNVH